MKKALTYLIFCMLFTSLLFAQSKRTLKLDDMFALQNVSHPQVSPDGKWVAYVVEKYNEKDDDWQSDLYMVPFTGGPGIQLTSSEKDDTHPSWSPDNKYLAFFSKREKKKQVFLLNRSGGEAVQLTDVKQGVDDFSWSPDGKKLALIISDADPDEPPTDDETKETKKTAKPIVIDRLQFLWDQIGLLKDLYSHIFIFDLQTKAMKQITSGSYDDGGPVYSSFSGTPQWSPDGKSILFASDRSNDPDKNRNMDIFVVSSEGGEPRKVTTNPGIDGGPRWSPDGKWIVYATNIKPELIWYETLKLAVIPANGGTPKILTAELDRNCMQPRFSADGKRIYFLLEDHGTQRLASISPDGTNVKKDLTTEKVIDDYDVGTDGKIVLLASRPQLPDEVFSWSEGKTAQLTATNASVLNQIQLGGVERAEFKSKDGTPVEGFVVKPPNFNAARKYPLLLWIHGGPTSQYAEQWEFTPQLLAANGYVVLLVNPRGSTGYGESFCKAIFADWGNKDYDDVMAGVDYALAQGYVDADHMGVAGWSYGGMLTDHVITKTNRFKAAASGASELNYLVDYGVDHYQYEWEKELGLPWENPEAYIKISPFFKIKNVKTPTLIMCGQEDVNVPFVNSEQFYQALKRLGVDTMFVAYPGQPHSFFKPSYQRDRLQRWLAWFGHYLQGQPNKVPPAEPQPQTQQMTAR